MGALHMKPSSHGGAERLLAQSPGRNTSPERSEAPGTGIPRWCALGRGDPPADPGTPAVLIARVALGVMDVGMRPEDEAVQIALATGHLAHRTGLRKRCPRCGREGWVLWVQEPAGRSSFTVIWDGLARGQAAFRRGGEHSPPISADVSERVHSDDLVNPTFGCGFDRPN